MGKKRKKVRGADSRAAAAAAIALYRATIAARGHEARVEGEHGLRRETRELPRVTLRTLRVTSSRSTRCEEAGHCQACGLLHAPLWRFAESSVGIVYLCTSCKGEAMERRRSGLSSWSGGVDAWHQRYRA